MLRGCKVAHLMAELDRRAPQQLKLREFFRNDLDRPLGRRSVEIFDDGVNKPGHGGSIHLHRGNPTAELGASTPSGFDDVERLKCLQVVLPKFDDYAASPTRIRASARCRRIASDNTSSPGIARASLSSTKPRARNSFTIAGSSRRRLPPANNLMRARCSNLVRSSQVEASAIGGIPRVSSVINHRAAKVNEALRLGK
jgi:hypothetical protein